MIRALMLAATAANLFACGLNVYGLFKFKRTNRKLLQIASNAFADGTAAGGKFAVEFLRNSGHLDPPEPEADFSMTRDGVVSLNGVQVKLYGSGKPN